MARLRCDFYAESLGMCTSMTAILPEPTANIGVQAHRVAADPPTLYLLHGLSDDDTTWTRQTSIERYAAEYGLAVIMPQVHRSFYTDQVHGHRYWTFLSEELPAIVARFFRLSSRREDTFVAGLSMGGYGALKWALRDPQRFAAAASLSGALDVARLSSAAFADDPGLWQRAFGEAPVDGTENDLMHLVEAAGPDLPRLYLCSGTEDHVYPTNLRFVEACRAAGVAVSTDFGPGDHEWSYWDRKIQDVLAWFKA